jgi:uncharacterized protein (TIGR00156 family)
MTHHLIAGLALITVTAAATAQYSGPSDRIVLETVEAALASTQDDQPIRLTGRLVRQIDEENFIFSDASGEIQVEIDDDDLVGVAFDETTPVEIVGEVERRRLGDNEVDVDRFRLITE